jgi:adenylosuccinate synthase
MADRALILVLSGPVCSGKTTLAHGLAESRGWPILTTRTLITKRSGNQEAPLTRRRLQELGDYLDRTEGGSWIAASLEEMDAHRKGIVVVDSIRTAAQLAALQTIAPSLHIHLTAPESTLAHRYEARHRANPRLELPSLNELRKNPTEASISGLAKKAALTIDTYVSDSQDTLHAAERLLSQQA